MCEIKHSWTSSNHFIVRVDDGDEEEVINKFFTPAATPEEKFIENVTEERFKLGQIARKMSQDYELLQAS